VLMHPEIPRYLAELAAEAVGLFVNQTGFQGTIEFFGSDVRLDLAFAHSWHGAMANDRRAMLFRQGTLGLALSGGNPFPDTFEMMACGLPVIDIDYNEKHISYGGDDTVSLVLPEPQALAEEIARLFRDREARDLLTRNAQRFAAQMPDEIIAATQFEQLLKTYLLADVRGTGDEVIQLASISRSAPEPAETIEDATPTAMLSTSPYPSPTEARGAHRVSPLRIDWVLPQLEVGSGGMHNILRAAHYLEKFGHDVGLIFNSRHHETNELVDIIQQHFYPIAGPVKIYDGQFRAADAIVATHWSTVGAALAAGPKVGEAMYFVQDFEPFFYPMSTEHILAENTYRRGLYCICAGTWCSHRLRREYGADADHYDYPLDRSVYFPRPRVKERTNVIFFARPEMPRRCYGLGIAMLREFHRLMPEVEIVMYGSRHTDAGALDFPATVRGVLPTINDLAQMYSDGDLGIAFATTNPSLVPYEMMACGLPVVDIAKRGAELNYGKRSDIAFLADQVPSRMAAQIRDLLMNSAECETRAQRGLQFVSQLPTAEEMARQVEQLIFSRLESRGRL
jgi:glycosyltransferase involved in cell wall biosynthesis